MRTKPITYVWQYALLALLVLFIIVPLLWLFSVAFKSQREILSGDLSWFPLAPTTENFVAALSEQPIVRSSLVSFAVAASAGLLTVVLALPAAYMMARFRGILGRVAMGWVLLSQMFPFILILIPLFMVTIQIGLYDNLLGLVLVYTVWNLPFAMWMLRNFIEGIPVDLEEQAQMDGATRFQTLRLVVAPLLAPGFATAAMFAFINSWNEFFFAIVLIRDQDITPLSLLIVRFIGLEGAVRLGPLAAAALLATIPSLIFFVLVQRRLTSGLVSGAVKG
jgi:multiple sugar transport system permease protein